MDRNWAKIDLSTLEGRQAFDSQRKAETGCYLSHLRLIKTVKERFDSAIKDLEEAQEQCDDQRIQEAFLQVKKYSSVLVLEDDNGFGIISEDRQTALLSEVGVLFRQAMSELPVDWEACYLMSWSKEPEIPVSKHIVKLTRANLTNAYAVNHLMYDAIIRQLSKIFDPSVTQINPVDNELAQLQKTHQCYAINPSIAYQCEGLSSITSKTTPTLRQHQPVYIPPNKG